ncbi:OmpA family protein [Paraburkholderia sp. J10-1]|uniref:OmpA family protein n=1 Tax=Paraburkholderia sp. J10-1 TaxID=2805430 RepID=UPI002AB631D2|nr:OmpA family protein [Paraburkholderia sp. J10-1]
MKSAPLKGSEGRAHGRTYPLRLNVLLAVILALSLIWLVLPLARATAWALTTVAIAVAIGLFVWRTRQLALARRQNAQVLAALGAAMTAIPDGLHTGMPLVMLTGDALPALFDRDGTSRLVWIGDGAIWLRVDDPRDLPRLAIAVRHWRDGRSPDGVVLSIAPAIHPNTDALTQKLRLARQSVADACRMLGTRLPAYVSIYQRLTRGTHAAVDGTRVDGPVAAQWHGVTTSAPHTGSWNFEVAVRAAGEAIETAASRREAATLVARSAGLDSLINWTQRVVLGTLADRQQPAAPWPLYGAGWIDCGPASGPACLWEREVEQRTTIAPAEVVASPTPWPLPQPLIEALPAPRWVSPWMSAFAHALTLLTCAAGIAFWGAAKNNEALLTRIGADLARFRSIPAAHDAPRRDALQSLVADRDQLDRYARTGVPLNLSFGMYHGAGLIPPLDDAIASYVPPPPPPTIVSLDSMSLFDSGKAQLRDGSNRVMVGAVEMIRANPGKRILVAGHTDIVGDPRGNLALSVARAGAVRDWLVDASGIPATQFAIQGYGDTRPVADNNTPEGRARNRRVEITLVPDDIAAHPATAAAAPQVRSANTPG